MYAAKLLLDKHVDLRTLARRTAGMTGAERSQVESMARASLRNSAQSIAFVILHLVIVAQRVPVASSPTTDALPGRVWTPGVFSFRVRRPSSAPEVVCHGEHSEDKKYLLQEGWALA